MLRLEIRINGWEKMGVKGYYTTVLFVLFILLDYVAIICAEQGAFWLRGFLLHSNNLHISWLNFWVIFPFFFLLFLHLNQLYSRRMPFYKEVELVFRSTCYGAVAVVLELYSY